MRRRTLAAVAAGLAAALPPLLAGCGGSSAVTQTVAPTGPTLDVYSSLPLRGPERAHAQAIVDGVRLALRQAQGHAGMFPVVYRSLDDTLPGSNGWEAGQVARNAVQAVEDGATAAYIGDFDSGATAISLPILEKSGIPQIAPAGTYDGLTTAGVGAGPGEPQRYYPAGRRTFVRLVPRDAIQANALVALMHGERCRAVAVADDGGPDGQGLNRLVQGAAVPAALRVVDAESVALDTASYRGYAESLRRLGADCVLYTGAWAPGARNLLGAVGAALPRARLYASDEVCAVGFPQATGALPRATARRLRCTAPPLAVRAYPRPGRFTAAYALAYGRLPHDGYALYGYEAMNLFLETVGSLQQDGGSRNALIEALFKVHDRNSPLGTYSINANGDTTLSRYGVYRLGPRGGPVYVRSVSGAG